MATHTPISPRSSCNGNCRRATRAGALPVSTAHPSAFPRTKSLSPPIADVGVSTGSTISASTSAFAFSHRRHPPRRSETRPRRQRLKPEHAKKLGGYLPIFAKNGLRVLEKGLSSLTISPSPRSTLPQVKTATLSPPWPAASTFCAPLARAKAYSPMPISRNAPAFPKPPSRA